MRPAAQLEENPFATVSDPDTLVVTAGWLVHRDAEDAGLER